MAASAVAVVCMAEPSGGRFHMRSIAHRGLHGPGVAQNSVEDVLGTVPKDCIAQSEINLYGERVRGCVRRGPSRGGEI